MKHVLSITDVLHYTSVEGEGRACIGNEDVQSAVLLHCVCDQSVHLGLLGDVTPGSARRDPLLQQLSHRTAGAHKGKFKPS